MRLVRTPGEMAETVQAWKRKGFTVGFAPTMGALHAGHLSLIRRARRESERVVVSVFVNPLQFGPHEDYLRYPRPFYQDRHLCETAHVDALFRPSPEAMVPEECVTSVTVEGLSELLCGGARPGHFKGVATVVLKLLHLIQPDRAYFGEKDFQQVVIIERMAADLNLQVEIVRCPTVRERDGLALSSRNAYLSPGQRSQARLVYQALRLAEELASRKGAGVEGILRAARRVVAKIPKVRIDYLRIVQAHTLQDAQALRGELRVVAAVWMGQTRLIDNIALKCKN